MSWKLGRTKQCAKCPWLIDVDPNDIPNGYCEDRHCGLEDTISDGSFSISGTQQVMACHESPLGKEAHCIGWLMNQLGPGNNIGLRLRMMSCDNSRDIKLIGEQHETFWDTLPDNK